VLECRLMRIKSKIEDSDKDIIVHLMEIYDRFYLVAQRKMELDMLPAFIQQVIFMYDLLVNINIIQKLENVFTVTKGIS